MLVHLRWLATQSDALWLCLWWLPLSTYLIFVYWEAVTNFFFKVVELMMVIIRVVIVVVRRITYNNHHFVK